MARHTSDYEQLENRSFVEASLAAIRNAVKLYFQPLLDVRRLAQDFWRSVKKSVKGLGVHPKKLSSTSDDFKTSPSETGRKEHVSKSTMSPGWKWLVPALGVLALWLVYSFRGHSPQDEQESLLPRAGAS